MTATTAQRINWTTALDTAVGNAYAGFGRFSPQSTILSLTGIRPTLSQVERSYGRFLFNRAQADGTEITNLRSLPQTTRNTINRMSRNRNGVAPTSRTNASQVRSGSDPLSVNRFGIEVEFHRGTRRGQYGQQQAIVDRLTDQGVNAQVERYNHDTQAHWKMTTDATVTGGEMVSPIMSGDNASLLEVREVIRAIKAEGGTTGKRVGMHVHHDITDFGPDQMIALVEIIEQAQDAILAFVPRSRHNGSNTYGATRMYGRQFETLRGNIETHQLLPAAARSRLNRGSGCGVTRYTAFNFNSVLTYGTIEFRALGNTLNPIKVRTWIEVGQAIVALARTGETFGGIVNVRQMVDTLTRRGLLATAQGERFVAECVRRGNFIDEAAAA